MRFTCLLNQIIPSVKLCSVLNRESRLRTRVRTEVPMAFRKVSSTSQCSGGKMSVRVL
jgi:hypothetical protein